MAKRRQRRHRLYSGSMYSPAPQPSYACGSPSSDSTGTCARVRLSGGADVWPRCVSASATLTDADPTRALRSMARRRGRCLRCVRHGIDARCLTHAAADDKCAERRGDLRAAADGQVRDTELAEEGDPVAVFIVGRDPLEYGAAFAYPACSSLGVNSFWPLPDSTRSFVKWRIMRHSCFVCLIEFCGADRNTIIVTNISKAKGVNRTVI